MKQKKIAIIGAGINGLYLAWKLAKKGESVIVFEKRDKIGKEACSGLFSKKILEFIPESKELIKKEINSVIIYFPKKSLKINFQNGFFLMDHFKLDNLVAKLAEKAGAKIILNQKNLKKEDILASFDIVIGTDGANSTVRKWLNLSSQNFFLGVQSFEKKEAFSDYVEAWPTKNGFIWKIPRNNKIEWGIMENPKKAKDIFDKFIKNNNINLVETKSSLIPKKFLMNKNKKITICGDAAGLTKPWSGGGVVWGLIAAHFLLDNFPDFLRYQREVRNFFLPRIIFSKISVKMVYFFGFNFPWFMPKNFLIKDDFLI